MAEAARATKERILDSAEQLFSDQGLAETSLRAITAAAEVNLAAVHYHFGSKEGLLEAVFARRIEPINRERLALLDRLEATDRGASLESILEAFLGPPLRVYHDPDRGGIPFMRLMGRVLCEPSPDVQKIFMDQFREIAERFVAAIRRTLPGLPQEDLFWRMHFVVGAMAHTMCDTFRLKLISGGLCEANDPEAMLRRLVSFAAAGLRASAAQEPVGGRS